MSATPLDTPGAVIDALGGTAAVARLMGYDARAVSNWRPRPFLPPRTYVVLQSALSLRGLRAPDALFGMVPPAGMETPAAETATGADTL